jgi:hypothetical protein
MALPGECPLLSPGFSKENNPSTNSYVENKEANKDFLDYGKLQNFSPFPIKTRLTQ